MDKVKGTAPEGKDWNAGERVGRPMDRENMERDLPTTEARWKKVWLK